jgi:hypothetical protein
VIFLRKILIAVLCIALIIIAGNGIYKNFNSKKTGKFSVLEYKEWLNKFPSDILLGEVLTPQSAKKEAEKIWIEAYGEKVTKEKPYKVSFDEAQNVWLVTGTFHNNFFGTNKGGVAYAIIQKLDGKVLAIWHDE